MQNKHPNTSIKSRFSHSIKFIWVFIFLFISQNGKTQNLDTTQNDGPITLRDGVVVNIAKKEIYLADSELNIIALHMETGNTVWRSDVKGRPLGMLKGKLVVQLQAKDNGSILFGQLNINNNGKISKQSKIKVPKNVKVLVQNTVDGSFFITPYTFNDNLIFEWSYLPPVSGDYNEDEPQKRESGAIVFNGRRFRNTSLPQLPKGYNDRSIIASKEQKIPKEDVQQFVSKNGKHLLVSSKDLKSTDFESYSWEIYEIATKERIGRLNSYRSYASFLVVNNTLIMEVGPYETFTSENTNVVPLQLVCYSLSDNKLLWEKEILNTLYLGSSPP